MAAQGIDDTAGSLHMTGGPHADIDNVLTRRFVTEGRIERGHTGKGGGGDVGMIAKITQRRLGKIVIVRLHSLQDLDHVFRATPFCIQDAIQHGRVKGWLAGHGASPMQNRCCAPRM